MIRETLNAIEIIERRIRKKKGIKKIRRTKRRKIKRGTKEKAITTRNQAATKMMKLSQAKSLSDTCC